MSVRRFSLGTVQFGLPYGIASQGGLPAPETVDSILDLALDAGIPSLDTAAAYGVSEQRIGRFIRRRGCDDAFEICTKLPALGECVPETALSGIVAKAVEGSLRRLSVPYIDEYLLHDFKDLDLYGRALIDALLLQQERGRIQRIGVSVYGPDDLVQLERFTELEVVQHPLSLLDQRLLASDTMDILKNSGISVHARSLFLQGLIAIPIASLPDEFEFARQKLLALHSILEEAGLSPMEAALGFARAAPVDKIVVGVDSVAHLQENIDAIATSMPAGLIKQLADSFSDVSTTIIDPRTWPEASA